MGVARCPLRSAGMRWKLLVTLLLLAPLSPSSPVAAVSPLAPGVTWNWQIGSTPTDADIALVGPTGRRLLDVDLDTPAAVKAKIKARGIYLVCYMETGSWESYRSDASSFPASVKGRTLSGYPDERYLDIRQLAVLRPIMALRLDRAAAQGCDGVEPDIDDGYLEPTGFPLSLADQVAYDRAIADDAHARGMTMGLKNGAGPLVAAMEPYTDFALNEQCNQYRECSPYAVFIAHGKAVLQVEYSLAVGSFCPKDRAAGFDGLKKRPALKALPRTAC